MLKITGGLYRGRNLRSVPGDSTRPPLSKVRAAVCNILTGWTDSAKVLDLFSGTGSYSFELLSRGAESCTCIDKNPKAVETIRKNVDILGVRDQVRVIKGDFAQVLPALKRSGEKYDIILVAPPYFTGLDIKAMEKLGSGELLSPWGVTVLQQHKREDFRKRYGNLVLRKEYLYGVTRVSTYILSQD